MITSSLSIFNRSIKHIESFISDYQSNENDYQHYLRAGHFDPILARFHDFMKKYVDLYYASKIISVYGCLERYIEDVISEYVISLATNLNRFEDCLIPGYAEKLFPVGTKLKSHHKYISITEENIIDSLYNCIRQDKIRIIPDVFFSTSGNYNILNISNSFSKLGFTSFLQDICLLDPLKTYLQSKHKGLNIANIKQDVLFLPIDDLVQRRNEIAHGCEIDDRISDAVLSDSITFIKNLVESINECVNNQLLSLIWKEKAQKTYKVSKARPRKRVVEFQDVMECNIKRGDKVLMRIHMSQNSYHYKLSSIKDIYNQKGRQLNSLKASQNKPRSFSIQLDTKVSDKLEVCFDAL